VDNFVQIPFGKIARQGHTDTDRYHQQLRCGLYSFCARPSTRAGAGAEKQVTTLALQHNDVTVETRYSATVSTNRRSDKSNERVNVFAVGDRIRVNHHTGRIVEATIKAVINRTDSPGLQVDFGKDETALIRSWQVTEKIH
jgi:hypothetical protein